MILGDDADQDRLTPVVSVAVRALAEMVEYTRT
jgi:hypothetical protein